LSIALTRRIFGHAYQIPPSTIRRWAHEGRIVVQELLRIEALPYAEEPDYDKAWRRRPA
jgi:hypothetical protein